jgi:hypothetical protein
LGGLRGTTGSEEGGAVSQHEAGSEGGQGGWAVVALAWILVGVPLLWGVWNTLVKAAALFK